MIPPNLILVGLGLLAGYSIFGAKNGKRSDAENSVHRNRDGGNREQGSRPAKRRRKSVTKTPETKEPENVVSPVNESIPETKPSGASDTGGNQQNPAIDKPSQA